MFINELKVYALRLLLFFIVLYANIIQNIWKQLYFMYLSILTRNISGLLHANYVVIFIINVYEQPFNFSSAIINVLEYIKHFGGVSV